MRAIILAAGKGTRFNGAIKGLLPIGNETLVSRLIRQLKTNGIDEIYLVVGYCAIEFLKSIEGVRFIYDKNFESGQNSNSLKTALDITGFEDTLMLDSDILLTDDLIPKIINSFKGESISLVDLHSYDEESMKLVIEGSKIIRYSKLEGIGAEICSIVTKKQLRSIYTDLASGLYRWWGIGPNTTGFHFTEADPSSRWFDIDTPDEYSAAKIVFH